MTRRRTGELGVASAGATLGYDRTLHGVDATHPYQVERFFVGGALGYDFVFRRRFVIGPALSAEYGRNSPVNVVRTWEGHPRLGIGFKFD